MAFRSPALAEFVENCRRRPKRSVRAHAVTVRVSKVPGKRSGCSMEPIDLAEPHNDLVPTGAHQRRTRQDAGQRRCDCTDDVESIGHARAPRVGDGKWNSEIAPLGPPPPDQHIESSL